MTMETRFLAAGDIIVAKVWTHTYLQVVRDMRVQRHPNMSHENRHAMLHDLWTTIYYCSIIFVWIFL